MVFTQLQQDKPGSSVGHRDLLVTSQDSLTPAERSKSSRQRKSREKRNSLVDGASSSGIFNSKTASMVEPTHSENKTGEKSKSQGKHQKSGPLSLNMSNKGLKSFEETYQLILDFAKTNQKTKYDFSKLNLQSLDLSNNKMTEFFGEERKANLFSKYKKVKKLTTVQSLNILSNLELRVQDCIM